jgi:hypothetical protein
MPNLEMTITNEAGSVTGRYTIECASRPGLDVEQFDTIYSINLIRCAAERHVYLADFPPPLSFSLETFTVTLVDLQKAQHVRNINELWLEIDNLMLGARLNFATSRVLKELEGEHGSSSDFDKNLVFDLHLEKMERFHLAVFELARIEDLIVRLVYEYFGEGFIETDSSQDDWEKKLTWNRMKESLNSRGKPEKHPHPALDAMSDGDYTQLMTLIRSYRSAEVVRLTSYRDSRTHRVTPSVDHPELSVNVSPVQTVGSPKIIGGTRASHFQYLDLYADAKIVYGHFSTFLVSVNRIIHA